MNIVKSKYMFKISELAFAVAILMAFVFTSCESADLDEPEAPKMHTCKLVFNVQKPEFENTRAESANWKEGDKIHLYFYGGTNNIYGVATYNSGAWSVSYSGSLSIGSDLTCTAVYVENPVDTYEQYVECNPNYGVYYTTKGVYSYDGTAVNVTATLSPYSGRIRFKGTPGEKIEVHGIYPLSSFEPNTTQLYVTYEAAKLTVASDGYTPYLYGKFSNANPYIAIETSDSFYIKDVPTTMYKQGESGFMNIPTKTSHSGWTYNERKELQVNGVTFPFVKVVKNDGTSFYLMQTEVTNEQYNSIMNQSTTEELYLPATKTFRDFWGMVTALNTGTGPKFRIPERDEWNYASKGGLNSKGYTYSGSNVLGEVAWSVTNSNNKIKGVKWLRPNELGLYDMNGNVAEFVMPLKNGTTSYLYYLGGAFNSSSISSYDNGYYQSFANLTDLLNSTFTQGIRLAIDSFN